MSQITITENGDVVLPVTGDSVVTQTESSTIMILENSANATLIFGCADLNGDFVPYPAGQFSDGKLIRHGKGCKLMVRVSGIGVGSVTIGIYPG